jgi:hypothetical protein
MARVLRLRPAQPSGDEAHDNDEEVVVSIGGIRLNSRVCSVCSHCYLNAVIPAASSSSFHYLQPTPRFGTCAWFSQCSCGTGPASTPLRRWALGAAKPSSLCQTPEAAAAVYAMAFGTVAAEVVALGE